MRISPDTASRMVAAHETRLVKACVGAIGADFSTQLGVELTTAQAEQSRAHDQGPTSLREGEDAAKEEEFELLASLSFDQVCFGAEAPLAKELHSTSGYEQRAERLNEPVPRSINVQIEHAAEQLRQAAVFDPPARVPNELSQDDSAIESRASALRGTVLHQELGAVGYEVRCERGGFTVTFVVDDEMSRHSLLADASSLHASFFSKGLRLHRVDISRRVRRGRTDLKRESRSQS